MAGKNSYSLLPRFQDDEYSLPDGWKNLFVHFLLVSKVKRYPFPMTGKVLVHFFLVPKMMSSLFPMAGKNLLFTSFSFLEMMIYSLLMAGDLCSVFCLYLFANFFFVNKVFRWIFLCFFGFILVFKVKCISNFQETEGYGFCLWGFTSDSFANLLWANMTRIACTGLQEELKL